LEGNIDSKTIEYENGDKFTGSLIEFEKEGQGYYQYAKGGDFTGYFKDNCLHGYGKYSFMGKIVSGIWIRDQQIKWFDGPHPNYMRLFYSDKC
jgi:hypothetical protein